MDRYLVIGNPIAHSRSPEIHAAFARQTGEMISYDRLLVAPGDFPRAVAAFFAEGGCGANVTLPFKLEAFAFARRLSLRAQAAGSVNTLKRLGDGVILGDNTDGAGLVRDLGVNLAWPVAGRRVLLLGAGGAARGTVGPLLAEGPACLVIANRTVSRAQELADLFQDAGATRAMGLDGDCDRPFDLVINATSGGTRGEGLVVPPGAIGRETYAYDMAYGEGAQAFLRRAREAHACAVADGLGMLVEQAAESFLLWRGVRPDTAPVIAMLRGA